jgi:hypothetical protein
VPTLRQPATAGAARARLDHVARERACARPVGDLADTESECPVPPDHATAEVLPRSLTGVEAR